MCHLSTTFTGHSEIGFLHLIWRYTISRKIEAEMEGSSVETSLLVVTSEPSSSDRRATLALQGLADSVSQRGDGTTSRDRGWSCPLRPSVPSSPDRSISEAGLAKTRLQNPALTIGRPSFMINDILGDRLMAPPAARSFPSNLKRDDCKTPLPEAAAVTCQVGTWMTSASDVSRDYCNLEGHAEIDLEGDDDEDDTNSLNGEIVASGISELILRLPYSAMV